MKYRALVAEWCRLIHELRVKKEELLPQYVLRALQVRSALWKQIDCHKHNLL